MAKPYEQDVILDADGKPLFSAMDIFERRVQNIQKLITNIQKDSYKSVADFNKTLDNNIKELRNAMAAMRTLNTPGQKDTQFTAALKEQSQQLKKNYDEGRALTQKEKRERQEALRETQRVAAQTEREITQYEQAETRKRVAAEIEAAKLIRGARLDAAKAELQANASAITSEKALARARADNIAALQRYRAAQKTETNPEQLRALATLIDMEKLRGRALEQNYRAQATFARKTEQDAQRAAAIQGRVARATIGSEAQRDVNKYGIISAREQAQYQQRVAQQQLIAASTDKERVAALQVLDLARARVAAVERIAVAQDKLNSRVEREVAAEKQLSSRQQRGLARSFAANEIANLGSENALAVATQRRAAAEVALGQAKGKERVEALRVLEIENARLRAIEAQIRAAGILEARERRQASAGTPSGPKGPESRLGNILSPGYAGAAFARTAVYGGAAMAAYGAFNAVQQGISNAIQLEDEFAKLQAISNSTDTTMQSLKASIYAVGETSRFATTDLVKISQTLAQAGISASEMTGVLKAVTTLATASGSTPDEAVQLVTSALGAFQLQGSEAARVADLMTEALNRTKLTVQQTGQAIQYVGATAFEQNISLEQLLATVGSVAQAGVKSGSTIGTGFRQFLVDLQEPSKKLTEQLERLGLSASDVDVSVRGLPAVLDTLRDAGFGAAQAYGGLEVRAAAFYLAAKNNVDVADKLQASFAYSTAAITAQDRAMNSLAAQWQRFKNIIGQGFAEDISGILTTFQNALTLINDKMLQSEKDLDALRKRQQAAREGKSQQSGFSDALEYDLMPAARYVGKRLLNGQLLPGTDYSVFDKGYDQLGTMLDNLDKKQGGATAASERLETQLAKTSEEAATQSGRIGELDKEMIRLITQKESLINNDTRSAAETATLTSRFSGLANQLVITGNRYTDLMNAARGYRMEQSRLLGITLTNQSNQLGEKMRQSRGGVQAASQTLLSNPNNGLTPQERAAVVAIAKNPVNSPEFSRGYAILSASLDRLNTTQRSLVNAVLKPGGDLAQAAGERSSIQPAIRQANFNKTGVGSSANEGFQNVQSIIERLGSARGADATKLAGEGNSLLNTLERNLTRTLTKAISGADRASIQETLSQIPSFRNQIKALVTPTAAETKAAERQASAADRQAKAAEREAARGAPLTQASLDGIIKQTLGAGVRLGSGTRTAGEQDALHAAGKTRATSKTSDHVTGIARDIPLNVSDADGERMAQALRVAFKNKGIPVQVKWENGKGANNGTGKHIHVGADRGARLKQSAGDAEDQAGFEYDTRLDQAQLDLDRQALAGALKDMARATTKESFEAAAKSAKVAMEKVNDDLRNAAGNELANAGIADSSDPRFQAKMQQVAQAIQQNVEDYQRKIADAILKNLDATLKAAQEAYEAALAPSQRVLATAQGQLSGLDRYSLRNMVPEQTRVLAQGRVGAAQESADRAQLAALPGLITQQRSALFAAQIEASKQSLSTDEMTRIGDQIKTITNNISSLVATREQLTAALGADGLIPKTLGQGLDQAVEAYSQLHGLNLTFTQQLNGEMLGAIDTLNSSLTTMFEGIITGSQSVLGAIGSFAKAIMAAISQIVAKIIATQIIKLLFSVFGASLGGASSGATSSDITVDLSSANAGMFAYQGGPVPGFAAGGEVMSGHDMRDSTLAKLAKGEFIMRGAAVKSVGKEFMHNLNRNGAAALDNIKDTKPIAINPRTETNVYLVKPDEQPQMGPNDVLVTWQKDVLGGGESKRLIQHVIREGNS